MVLCLMGLHIVMGMVLWTCISKCKQRKVGKKNKKLMWHADLTCRLCVQFSFYMDSMCLQLLPRGLIPLEIMD